MTPAEIAVGTVLILFFLGLGFLVGLDLWKAIGGADGVTRGITRRDLLKACGPKGKK